MRKIIFVGIHNKPSMGPLDSSTKSGKLIDRVIDDMQSEYSLLDRKLFIKSNLFDALTISEEDPLITVYRWMKRVNYNMNDIVICLGSIVSSAFRNARLPITTVELIHPSHIWSNKAKCDYVHGAVETVDHTMKFTKILIIQ